MLYEVITLLRVLEDRRIRRLGGTRNIDINVRVVAATNRDLREAIDAREFREDLFYRLNVFPIRITSYNVCYTKLLRLQNERLAAIGQMAAGISHEIDNPVGVILGYAELLLEDLAPEDPCREHVQAIIDECRRCKRITGGLLNLARHREGERKCVDLEKLVGSVVDSIKPQALFP